MFDHGKTTITGDYSGSELATPLEFTLNVNGKQRVHSFKDTEDNEFSYTPDPALGDSDEHTVIATVKDANGKTAEATVVFSVRLPVPTIAINTPAEGQIYDHGKPIISGVFSGAEPQKGVTLSINGEAVKTDDVTVTDNNEFTYTPVLDKEGEYTVEAEVTDANGRTAKTSAVFSVAFPIPTVAIHAPTAGHTYDTSKLPITGEFTGVGDVTVKVTIGGEEQNVTKTGNQFAGELTSLTEGQHTVEAEVTDDNGKSAKTSAVFSVAFPIPTVTIHAPAAGHTYDMNKLPITGEFTGVGDVTVKVTVGGAEQNVTKTGNQFAGELTLKHGSHTVEAEVTDANNKSAKTSAVFTVSIPGPTVAILSPAPGQIYDHGQLPVVRAEFSGKAGGVHVSKFTINGEDIPIDDEDADAAKVADNMLTYKPASALAALEAGKEHVVVVEVKDENNNTAKASVVFSVQKDATPPIISEVFPSGVIRPNTLDKEKIVNQEYGIIISAVVTDEQSPISSVQLFVDNNPSVSVPAQKAENKVEIEVSVAPGPHTVKLVAVSQGGSREFKWQFTLEVDHKPPVISSITPAGTIHAGLPIISASATDEMGVQEMTIVVMDSNGKEVKGKMMDDSKTADKDPELANRLNPGITRLDFHPEEPLSEGTYAIEVRATDTFGNTSTAKGGFTVDFDTAAPIITSASPQNDARLMIEHDEKGIRPTISITYGDAETGVNVDNIRLVIEAPKEGGGTLGGENGVPIDLSDEQKSATQVMYTPAAPHFPNGFDVAGKYTVRLEIFDNAHLQGNVNPEYDDEGNVVNEGARKANAAVHQFSFFVEKQKGPILAKPINFPNPFKDNTRISFGLNRMSTVTIVIYDATGRPVRVLMDNQTLPAGDYTGNNGYGWDGKTSAGENLARGIYFCQITVADGVEPEYVILKLALTR